MTKHEYFSHWSNIMFVASCLLIGSINSITALGAAIALMLLAYDLFRKSEDAHGSG